MYIYIFHRFVYDFFSSIFKRILQKKKWIIFVYLNNLNWIIIIIIIILIIKSRKKEIMMKSLFIRSDDGDDDVDDDVLYIYLNNKRF